MDYKDFIQKHGLAPEVIDVEKQSEEMLKNMISGLNGNIVDMPMIPTYLTVEGQIPEGKTAVVIDAGGTNFRCALATYTSGKFEISDLFVSKMPGVEKSVSWNNFIIFVADAISPLMDRADNIGFCFSYSAQITPEKDGLVSVIDKEVTIEGCEGKLVGGSLLEELSRRGFNGKKCVVLNDTVAALLGNAAFSNKDLYSGYMGMICGTGVNTCASYNGMLINLESGFYSGMPRGDYDIEVDNASANPGDKLMEKMCSGAYIGQIAKLALDLPGDVDGATVDALSQGNDEFKREVCLAIFERSAKCMAANIIALMKLTGSGLDKPFCVCAEGSLINRSANYLPFLEDALNNYSGDYKAQIIIGRSTTLPGSAYAALLNS